MSVMTHDQFLQFQALGSEALQIKYLETMQVQAKEKTLQEKEITRRRELDILGLILTRRIIYLNNIFINYMNKLNNNKYVFLFFNHVLSQTPNKKDFF